MKLFDEKPVTELFVKVDNKINENLKFISDAEIMKINSDELAKTISDKFKIDFNIEIDFDNVDSEIKMVDVTGQKYINTRMKNFTAVIYYSFPIIDNPHFLQYYPENKDSLRQMRNHWVVGYIENNKLIIPISTDYANPDLPDEIVSRIKGELVDRVNKIKSIIQILKSECDEFDAKIHDIVFNSAENEKVRLEKVKLQKDKLNPFK